VGRIDLDAVSRDRDQLWAEAVVEFRKKTPHWIQPDEVAEVETEQMRRTDVDVWTDAIADLAKTRTAVYQNEILKDLGIPLKDANDRHAARIGRVMKKLGWGSDTRPHIRRGSGEVCPTDVVRARKRNARLVRVERSGLA
jgi:predicted P-loop ATPase